MQGYIRELKKNNWFRFGVLCLILVMYFLYITYKYDAVTGGVSSLLLWSLFVLCTPIADGGFLLDFPLKILFNIKMFTSEIFVWGIAIISNLIIINFYPDYYNKTTLTKLLYLILSNPYPYWSIILLSGIGTFLSVHFGDEVIDGVQNHNAQRKQRHKNKYHMVLSLTVIIIIVFLYYELLDTLHLEQIASIN